MPVYEYICVTCSTEFEVFFKTFSSEKRVICNECGSTIVDKKVSAISYKISPNKDSYFSDSSNIGKHVEKTYSQHGMDIPDTVRKSIDDARKGKMPGGLGL
jgi:putative FmdB family regulatory protein